MESQSNQTSCAPVNAGSAPVNVGSAPVNAGNAPVSSNTGYMSPVTQSSTTGPLNSQPANPITGAWSKFNVNC